MKRLAFGLGLLLAMACDSETPQGSVRASTPSGEGDVFARATVEGDLVKVSIVTRDAPALSGAALRVEHPAWLTYEGRDERARYTDGVLHFTKATRPTEVTLADVRKGQGEARPALAGEADLTTLTFKKVRDPSAQELGRVHFVAERSELRKADGSIWTVKFADVTFTR
jgi:hypothetical protein